MNIRMKRFTDGSWEQKLLFLSTWGCTTIWDMDVFIPEALQTL